MNMIASATALTTPDDSTPVFDDINGNWDEVRQFLSDQVRGEDESDILTKSIEANSRAAQIALFGGPVQLEGGDLNRGTVSMPTRGGSVARAFWWGFHIQLSHEDVQLIVSIGDGAAQVISAISAVVPSVIRPWLAIVGVFLKVSVAVLRALDRGRGVYISMSWFAAGVFVPTSV